MIGERVFIVEFSAALAVNADEIRVAKFARRTRAIALKSAPQIASGEAQEHGGASGLRAFSLKGQETFLDGINGHDARRSRFFAASKSRQPFARNSQAGQALQP